MLVRLNLQLDDLMTAVLALARGRVGRVVAVRVAVPGAFGADDVTRGLQDRLATAGLSGVEVTTKASTGVLRLLSVEFVR
ncbi:MAG: hypothetical protein Q7U06_01530 [Pseudomonadota bacterium]|nr:hypothetical protein [Pseudomonadota bacterium]